jgi:hypothetical protein
VLRQNEQPLAALTTTRHSSTIPLLDAVSAAARLALENSRLQADLRAQVLEVRASRARIVSAGDSERRRIEQPARRGAAAATRRGGSGSGSHAVTTRPPTSCWP